MTSFFNGIAKAAESIFPLVKTVGDFTNYFFMLAITVGTIYWLWYDAKVRRGGKNFMSDKG